MNPLRWLACPLIVVIFHGALLRQPQRLLALTPPLWATGGLDVDAVLPPAPQNLTQAFDIGAQTTRFEECERAGDRDCAPILAKASELMGVPISAAKLRGMRSLLVEMDGQRSIRDRVLGFFSFVNILCCVSVMGAIATVVPFLAYLFGPFVLRISRWILTHAIEPAVKWCHRSGVFEVLAYAAACLLSAQSLRYLEAHAQAAASVALLGGMACAPCIGYTHRLHLPHKGGSREDVARVQLVTCTFMTLVLGALTLAHSSSLLGFFAVAALYGALGFSFGAFPFGFFIGFDSTDALQRCLLSSALLVVTFAALRISGTGTWAAPFAKGVMVLGNVVYFLALLILSNRWRRRTSYALMNALNVCSLLLAMFVGSVCAMPAMSNTATTFCVLWLMQKQFELSEKLGGAVIVLVFANFVALYAMAHFLSTHPGFVYSLFDPTGIYAD